MKLRKEITALEAARVIQSKHEVKEYREILNLLAEELGLVIEDVEEDSTFGKVLCVNASQIGTDLRPYAYNQNDRLVDGQDMIFFWLGFDEGEGAREWWDIHIKNMRDTWDKQ